MWVEMILISIALSIDAFAVGISYGVQKIKIESKAFGIVGLVSILIMSISLNVGKKMAVFFPEDVLRIIGVSILVLLGISFIRKSLYTKEQPAMCDYDQSKDISWIEGIAVGVAISIDTVSVAIGLSASGLYNMFIPWLVGVTQILFLFLGCICGKSVKLKMVDSEKRCNILSGFLLILIAVVRAFS